MGREHSSLTLGYSRSMHGSYIMLLFAETQFTLGRIFVTWDGLHDALNYLLPDFLPKLGLLLGFWACQGAWFLPVFLGFEVYWSSPGFFGIQGTCSLPVFLGLEVYWPSPGFLPCHGACSLPVVLGLEVYWPSPGFLPCHGA
jgi:hypothetical protein